MNYQGVVSKVSSFPYNGKNLWSFQLSGDRAFYRTGNVRPNIQEGDFVNFLGVPGKNGSVNVDSKSIQSKSSTSEQSGTGVGNLVKPRSTGTAGSKDDYWANREARDVVTQARIERQACRNSALQFVNLLVSQGAIKFSDKAKDKDKVAILEEAVSYYQEKYIADNDGPKESAPPANHVEQIDEEVPY